MMTNISGSTPNNIFTNVYGGGSDIIQSWAVNLDEVIGTQFVIPSTLDGTQPVTLTLHRFSIRISTEGLIGGDVRWQLQSDYQTPGNQVGSTPPGTGLAETLTTLDHTVDNTLAGK